MNSATQSELREPSPPLNPVLRRLCRAESGRYRLFLMMKIAALKLSYTEQKTWNTQPLRPTSRTFT
jgi:hypothetical protein